jgi:catechol 2,3-dioxygenase-like lactoylglutathione lyase family enzyme
MTLDRVAPMLLCNDMQETIDFYTKGLGFTLEATLHDPPTWCSLRRDGVTLMFEWYPPHDHAPGEEHDHPDPGMTGALYLYVSDAKELHDEVASRVEICEALNDRPYGMREFGVLDPNGYRLQFGSRA